MTGLRFFYGDRPHFRHEFEQLRELTELVAAADLGGPVYVVTNFLIANGEVDCLLLLPHGLVVIELKAYLGTVHGVEEGDWRVVGPDGAEETLRVNLFHQLRTLRFDVIRRLLRIRDEAFPQLDERDLKKVAAWGYFQAGSTYPPGQIELERVKWFDIVTAETLVERLMLVQAGFTLSEREMDAIVGELRVTPAEGLLPVSAGERVGPVPATLPAREPAPLEQALVERMDALVTRMEAIPRAIAGLARPEEVCTTPPPGTGGTSTVPGGCSDAVGPDETETPLVEQIRSFVCTEYAAPARREGRTEFTISSGEIHRAMGLSNRMPEVCGALRSRRLEALCRIELVEEVRSVRVRENSSTNRFVYRIK